MSAKTPEERRQEVINSYQAVCPDVIHIEVAGRPDLSGDRTIGPDGRVLLGAVGGVRVEGHTIREIAGLLAVAARLPVERVAVSVAQYNSQHVLVMGEVAGSQRVQSYQGQETVLELLQRTGGITRGAAPESIYVVRNHVENGQRPEIFHVDLNAIVEKKDERTNIRILPFDQIHVGSTRQSRVENVLPPWLRPLYQELWDTRPDPADVKPPPPATPRPRMISLFPQERYNQPASQGPQSASQ